MKKEKRFEILDKQGLGITGSIWVLKDTKTRVQYLLASSGYGFAITPLLNKDGKLLTDIIEEDE